MIRNTLFILAILATATAALAAVHPDAIETALAGRNVTIIEKTSPFPVLGPITVEQCALEDCSDTQS